MHPTQHTMITRPPGLTASLRVLLLVVVAVAIVEAVVIGYLVLRPAAAAVAIVPSRDAILAGEWLVDFHAGERSSIAAPAGAADDFLAQHRADERSSLVPVASGARTDDDWVLSFRIGEHEQIGPMVWGAEEWQRLFRATERTGG